MRLLELQLHFVLSFLVVELGSSTEENSYKHMKEDAVKTVSVKGLVEYVSLEDLI